MFPGRLGGLKAARQLIDTVETGAGALFQGSAPAVTPGHYGSHSGPLCCQASFGSDPHCCQGTVLPRHLISSLARCYRGG